ncbi:hypothetical protein Gotri_003019 [Gossypium trilobum]|uniref:DNA/RNA-binding protein Alba-like domain-containing protein n=1 Tax=Gossypium trilobum TaxID=34281 RepID=A0A7J9FA33_9ROSI|nr:hypothetical protein [Gossypium trilobum]
MDRYQKVEKPKADTPINENELRITAQGRMRNYISYAITLLQEKGANEIVLKATGRAINKTVMIAELIKRRIAGLHQNTSTGSIDITDTWEPLEEGLLPLETTRHVSIITITLSKKELDSSSIGYQPPIPADQVKPSAEFEDNEGATYMTYFRQRQGNSFTYSEEAISMVAWWSTGMEDGMVGEAMEEEVEVEVVDEVEEGDVEAVVVRVSHPMVHSRKVLETTRALILRFFCRTLALVNKKSCPFSTLIKALFFTWRICVVRDL